MNKGETPLSLKKICDLKGYIYNTVRRHRVRYPDTFPKPVTTRADGDGTSWYPSEVINFYETRKDGRTYNRVNKNDNS